MARAETSDPVDDLGGARWFGSAFGLRVSAPGELETLSACDGPGDEPTVWTRVTTDEAIGDEWRNGRTTRVVDQRFPDGRPMMSIDTDSGGAFLVESPGYGAHLVSADGMRITSVLPPDAPWNWQRLFVAQALPLAAALRGFEPLHASAVAVDGCAIAFSAPSGTGKTSIAMHLVAAGAMLMTDDVLALEATQDSIQAHPGARLLAADSRELAAVENRAGELGTILGDEGKIYLRPVLASRPMPLGALYRLVRRPPGGEVRIVEEAPPQPRDVLATTFLAYVTTPERMTRHLELAVRLAHTARFFVAHVPAGTPAQSAAALLEHHVRAEVLES